MRRIVDLAVFTWPLLHGLWALQSSCSETAHLELQRELQRDSETDSDSLIIASAGTFMGF